MKFHGSGRLFRGATQLVSRSRQAQRTSAVQTSRSLYRQYPLSFTLFRPISSPSSLGYAKFSTSGRMMEPLAKDQEPYNYTSGRWLRRDTVERELRVIHFDFDALQRKIIELCPNASAITSYEKKEGGFNRVFIFHTNNQERIIARLPFKLAGPPRLTTNSEVATIKYLQAKTTIPVPKILDWSDDASNAIGSEYIIMEHAPGVSLHQRWPIMDVNEQIRCIDAVYQKLKELLDLQFPAYGSLYLADSSYIAATGLPLDHEFSIGPHCGAMYWDCNIGQPKFYHTVKPNHGPWPELTAYCDGLVDTGISRIPPAGRIEKRPRYQGSIATHHGLLEYGRRVIKTLATVPSVLKAATPILFHPDLHKRNIFVSEDDPTIITAFIDWQSASIEPAFWYADETPDFAQPIPDSSNEEQFEPKSKACAKAFDVCTRFLTPKLSEPKSMDESYFRLFRYCYRTWEDGAVAFREELIQTSRRWNELGLAGSSPFPLPYPEDLAIHQQHYKLFEAAHQLRHSLSGLLNTASDGWVPPEELDAAKIAQHEVFNGILQEVLGNESPDDDEPIKDEEDLREIWPFDLKD